MIFHVTNQLNWNIKLLKYDNEGNVMWVVIFHKTAVAMDVQVTEIIEGDGGINYVHNDDRD
jgi:hypothetical protein